MTERTCPRCKETKPLPDFYKSKRTGNGLTTYCKSCIRGLTAERQAAMTPEQKRAAQQRRAAQIQARRDVDPEFDALFRSKSNEASRKSRSIRPGREWRTGNREEAKRISREANRRYNAADPERYRIINAIRSANLRASRMGIEGRLVYRDWQIVLERLGHRCLYCQTGGCLMDLEHVQPVARGGTNSPDNIAPACRPCNAQKNRRSFAEFCALRGLDEAEVLARLRGDIACAAA